MMRVSLHPFFTLNFIELDTDEDTMYVEHVRNAPCDGCPLPPGGPGVVDPPHDKALRRRRSQEESVQRDGSTLAGVERC